MTIIHISHGAGAGRADAAVPWFVVLPPAGEPGHEAAVGSLTNAGRTVYELEVTPWQGGLVLVTKAEGKS